MSSKKRKKQKNSRKGPDKQAHSIEYMPVRLNMDQSNSPEESELNTSEVVIEPKRKSLREKLSKARDEESPQEIKEMESRRRRLIRSAWLARDQVFEKLFGTPSYVVPDNYSPPSEEVPEDFLERREKGHAYFASAEVEDTGDPGDPLLDEQQLAVLAYGPDPLRPYWTYITAGLSTPWLQYQSQEASGFGCEIMVKSPQDAPWAPRLLQTLALYVFSHMGVLSPGARIAVNGSIDPSRQDMTLMSNAFIWYADEAPEAMYELPSGFFGILCAVGITDDERAYAESVEEYGTWCINAVLRKTGHNQITDPLRESVMKRPDIEQILESVTGFANAFRLSEQDKASQSEDSN